MSEFVTLMSQMKRLLDQPLPGGRGAQAQRDMEIRAVAQKMVATPLPDRSFRVLDRKEA
jgi:hypothetical protein